MPGIDEKKSRDATPLLSPMELISEQNGTPVDKKKRYVIQV
jgi:hypothetical protein